MAEPEAAVALAAEFVADVDAAEADEAAAAAEAAAVAVEPLSEPAPAYRHPGKKWRVKQGSTPNWYKARAGIRTKALSGAARVARHRPPKLN